MTARTSRSAAPTSPICAPPSRSCCGTRTSGGGSRGRAGEATRAGRPGGASTYTTASSGTSGRRWARGRTRTTSCRSYARCGVGRPGPKRIPRSRDSERGQWEALGVPVLGARWWRLPRRREASVTECAWCVPRDWAALTGLRVARPVDPQIGIDLRMQRVRGRWGSEPPEARIAPHRYPPAASPVMDGAAAVLGGVDDEVLAAGEPRDLEAVPDVGSSPVVVSGVEHKAAHLGDPDLA